MREEQLIEGRLQYYSRKYGTTNETPNWFFFSDFSVRRNTFRTHQPPCVDNIRGGLVRTDYFHIPGCATLLL